MKLEIDSVRLSFDKYNPILSDVYANFNVGQISSLLGRNGTGKSTLFKVIFGSLNPEFATIRIDGKYHKELYKSGQIKFLSFQNN
jgi:ABC-type Mn2+/Zn2+ transport system ATPase subunit